MNELITDLRAYVLAHHLPGESPESLRNDTPLQTSGILDSMAVLGLVTWLEQRCSVVLDFSETTPERFDTITQMATVALTRAAGRAKTA